MIQTNTRMLILDEAEKLLQERGFNGFSYQDIAKKLGVKNAAIHYHYPTKSNLGCALIERYRLQFREWIASCPSEPLLRLKAYFAIPVEYLRHGARVCPLGVLEAEIHGLSNEMRDAVTQFDQETRTFLTDTLQQGRETEVFSYQGTAQDKALVIASSIQGALQIARVAGSKILFRTIRQILTDLGIG